MKKLLVLMAILLGGAYAVRGLLGGERLARLPATMMERCMEMMPEDSLPIVMMSSLCQLQEQSDELLALQREQNELLRERLPGKAVSEHESVSPAAKRQ
jgi:hypothetical protein